MTPESVARESAWDLYENAPCGYVVAGPDRSIVSMNATLLGWLGHEPNALIGKPFTDLLAVEASSTTKPISRRCCNCGASLRASPSIW